MAADEQRLDDDRDLAEALRQDMARRRRKEVEPPTPEELLAYRDGRLDDEERGRVEEKITAYPEAARAVLDLSSFPDVEPAPGVRTVTRDEVADDWRSLRRRMAEERAQGEVEEVSPSAVKARPTPEVAAGRSIASVWGRAAALLAAVGVGVLVGVLLRPPASAPEPDAASNLTLLAPASTDSVRGAAGPAVDLGRRQILVLDAAGLEPLPAYDLVLRDEAGDERWAAAATRPNAQGLVPVTLPESFLPPGEYRAELYRPGESASPMAVYPFEVVGQGLGL